MKNTNLNIRVSSDLKEEIEAIAYDNYVTPSEFVRFSLQTVINSINKENNETN
jgi:antitoxin component of RelBE/YafQ-DinJ toxin-antitoxin module